MATINLRGAEHPGPAKPALTSVIVGWHINCIKRSVMLHSSILSPPSYTFAPVIRNLLNPERWVLRILIWVLLSRLSTTVA